MKNSRSVHPSQSVSRLTALADKVPLQGSNCRHAIKQLRCFDAVRYRKYYALECTDTNSGLPWEFWMDLIASSAVNLPIASASLRLVVVWIGVRSIRRTNSAARAPRRFTLTTNLMLFLVCPAFILRYGPYQFSVSSRAVQAGVMCCTHRLSFSCSRLWLASSLL